MRSVRKTHQRVKSLRGELSPPEALLLVRLRTRSPECPVVRRQHAIGPYIVDFYCAAARLVIEIDGDSHWMGDRPQRDEAREAFLMARGLRVMRYSAGEVMADPNGVADGIMDAAAGFSR